MSGLERGDLARARVLLVGIGGLGSPAAMVLAKSGVGSLTILDDDAVEPSNLHRQVLFEAADVGADKATRAAEHLRALGVDASAERARLRPADAVERIGAYDLVIEGADNYATKFLAADACAAAGVPLVSAGAVRWSGWCLAWRPDSGRACLRCVFEDIPGGRVETCAGAGVIGPVVGVLGGLGAALGLRLLSGDADAPGELWSYGALEGRLRTRRLSARPGCANCSGAAIEITPERYAPAPVRDLPRRPA